VGLRAGLEAVEEAGRASKLVWTLWRRLGGPQELVWTLWRRLGGPQS
jgi:hypothetical protein